MKKNIYNILFFTLFVMAYDASYASYKVSDVDSNANILLEGDKTVRFDGIYIPTTLKSVAVDYIKRKINGKNIELKYDSERRDLYNNYIVSDIKVDGSGVLSSLLKYGMAVNYDSNISRIDREKASAEQKARNLKKGLWSKSEGIFLTKVEVEENSNEHLNKFRIVKGKVKSVKLVKDKLYINFGDDWRKDFTVKISKKNLKNFDSIETLVNKDVIVKGWIEFYNGPAMEIYNQSNLDIM